MKKMNFLLVREKRILTSFVIYYLIFKLGASLMRRVAGINVGQNKAENNLPLFSRATARELRSETEFGADKVTFFEIQNRRYLGNKYKLLPFIENIVVNKCTLAKSFCDIFAGTGVVGHKFNNPQMKIISNDLLFANYVCLNTFLNSEVELPEIKEKISYLNGLNGTSENYFSTCFGGRYFSHDNARKIGIIREEIEKISITEEEKNILICSLIYAADKVANTVGHYDAFRRNMDMLQPVRMMMPSINYAANVQNEVYSEDANELIKKIECDVLYLDPPYNSRQYSDCYHILENLSEWKKPSVVGIAKKMNRQHIKSNYCLKNAPNSFANLIKNANCQHILLSYNNTKSSKDGRSNARITDEEIMDTLSNKGQVEIFEQSYRAFSTGKSHTENNVERIFYCKVKA